MLEPLTCLDVIRARRPCKIVHVFLVIPMRCRSVGIINTFALLSCGGKRPAAWNGHPHVVHAEIRKELRADMKLMAVPFPGCIEHADFWKPLRDEEVVADRASACERPWNFCGERDVENNRLPRRDGPGSVTAITVRSFSFPSSGAMNRICFARSMGGLSLAVSSMLEISMAEKSSPRRAPADAHHDVSLCSRIHVDSSSRHAL